ncbi:NAD(P)-binding domain-containing protein [Nonomuraea wenchangensis]|uniref:NAD(P)-binding domain-containing protein n=1 Tax=Nonomuraea wenchangensis TaxID=568860 RepID=UPI003721E736
MGRAIAAAFLAAGHPTTVWNRAAGKAGELLARGAVWADSPLAALDAAEVVIICVIDANAVDAILGREQEAEVELRAVLEECRRVLGEEHPDTLSSRNNLTDVLHHQERQKEIEVSQARSVEKE